MPQCVIGNHAASRDTQQSEADILLDLLQGMREQRRTVVCLTVMLVCKNVSHLFPEYCYRMSEVWKRLSKQAQVALAIGWLVALACYAIQQ